MRSSAFVCVRGPQTRSRSAAATLNPDASAALLRGVGSLVQTCGGHKPQRTTRTLPANTAPERPPKAATSALTPGHGVRHATTPEARERNPQRLRTQPSDNPPEPLSGSTSTIPAATSGAGAGIDAFASKACRLVAAWGASPGACYGWGGVGSPNPLSFAGRWEAAAARRRRVVGALCWGPDDVETSLATVAVVDTGQASRDPSGGAPRSRAFACVPGGFVAWGHDHQIHPPVRRSGDVQPALPAVGIGRCASKPDRSRLWGELRCRRGSLVRRCCVCLMYWTVSG